MKHAVIAIEDQRFYEHKGVDYQGIARALWPGRPRQQRRPGRLDDHQQFVKNALVAQRNRSVFQKLSEAALAYHLERKWTKDKILTEYLNTVYFGNGAYGDRVRGARLLRLEPPRLRARRQQRGERSSPAEAALLAGHDRLARRLQPGPEPGAALKRRTWCSSACSSRT